MKISQLILVAACAALCMAAQPSIEIEGARFRLLKLAVPNVTALDKTLKDAAYNITEKVRNDLEWCGVFQVLDPKSYLGDGLNTVSLKNWQMIGSEGLVHVQISLRSNDLFAQVSIYQLGSPGKSLITSIRAPKEQISQLSHKIAGDVYKFFTNEEGIFFARIAAAKVAGKNKQIVVMDFDGENQRSVTDGAHLTILPSFSPSGREIFFTEYVGNPNLVAVDLVTKKKSAISSRSGLNMGASISPLTGDIAMTLSSQENSHVHLLNRKDGSIKQLTSGWGISTSPSWSPDGSTLAFVSSRSGNPHIYTMNADGSNQVRRTFQGNYNQTPRWSPQGDVIAFTARDEQKHFDIFLLDVKSWEIRRVTQNQGDNEDPSFSPNGKMMVFSSTRTGKREIFLSNLDGSRQRQLTHGGGYNTPAFGKGW